METQRKKIGKKTRPSSLALTKPVKLFSSTKWKKEKTTCEVVKKKINRMKLIHMYRYDVKLALLNLSLR